MALKAPFAPALPGTDNAMSRLLPIATTMLAALLSIEPVHIPGYSALTPAFILMAAYHWTIYRPDLLPPLALFLIGAAYDLLAGAPLGVTPLLLLAARAIVLRQRRHFLNRPFPFVWAGFALLTGAAMPFSWLMHCLLAGALLDLRGTIFRAVLTISVFPLFSFLLGRTQRALMGAG
jgi:rod shape-determining protein MreD